ncbi:MAG: hypothetical protein FJ356_06350 [Thaumarchaeota archaeon]|nr:hypothetical protein [Nitrososphaerota archaeon]
MSPLLGTRGGGSVRGFGRAAKAPRVYSLVAHWDMANYNGTTISDSSGNGYTATKNNGNVSTESLQGRQGVRMCCVRDVPGFTINIPNLTEITVIAVATNSGANNGKHIFMGSSVDFNMEGGGGYDNKPSISGNGAGFWASGSHGPTGLYTYVLANSTSQVAEHQIRFNRSDIGIEGGGAKPSPTNSDPWTATKFLQVDEYNGIGNMTIWEMKVFNKALLPAELATEEAYFNTKWGY